MNNFLRKIFLFLFFLFRFVNFINAQNWTVVGGGPYYDFGKALAVDKNGNVYSFAYLSDSAIFQDTTFIDGGLLLTKFDSLGQRQWFEKINFSWADLGDMLVDNNGNVYVTGVFSDTITFADTTLTLYGDFYRELFIAKFNTDGVLQWARRSNKADDSTSVGSVYNLAFSGFDSTGNIQLLLYYLSNLVVLGNDSLYGVTFEETPVHALARIDTNGNFIWNKIIRNADSDLKPMFIDSSGNFYLAGLNNFSNENYLFKYDFFDSSQCYNCTNTHLWMATIDGEISGAILDGTTYAFEADGANNIYFTTYNNSIYNNHNNSIYKFSPSGELIWKKQTGYGISSYSGIGLNKKGDIVVNGGGVGFPSDMKLFFAKYDSSGNFMGNIFLGKKTDTTENANCSSYDIFLDDNNIYATGYFSANDGGLIFFDDTVNGDGDFLITKFNSSFLDTNPFPFGINNISFADDLILNAYPNPFTDKITLLIKGKKDFNFTITNLIGEVIFFQTYKNWLGAQILHPDLEILPEGLYFFTIKTNTTTITKKIIKL